jgi:hypothetical protein
MAHGYKLEVDLTGAKLKKYGDNMGTTKESAIGLLVTLEPRKEAETEKSFWLLDSGSSVHVTTNREVSYTTLKE